MKYECFKKELVNRLKEYLPEKYQSWNLMVHSVNKVNRREDAFCLISEKPGSASPTLYVSRYFERTLLGDSIEEAIRLAATEFLAGMRQLENMPSGLKLENPEKRVFYMLVSTEKNGHILEKAPHRSYLDLSLIYRVMVEQEECGFSSTVVTWDLAEQFGLSEEELFALAKENTPKLLPPEVLNTDSFFFIIGNKRRAFGAVAVLYDGILERVAACAGRDLYLIPSSVHEMIAVPAAEQNANELRKLVKHGNSHWVEPGEVLSGEIYYYSRKEGRLEKAADGNLFLN